MDRRGFLARFTAAAAAFTAAARGGVSVASLPAPASPQPPIPKAIRSKPGTPSVSITADTARFEQAVGDAGRQVVELLRECRVTHSEWCHSVGEAKRYRVIFEERPKSAPLSDLDHEAWKVIEQGYLTSINVAATHEPCEIVMLGEYKPIDLYAMEKVQHTLTAEFIVR